MRLKENFTQQVVLPIQNCTNCACSGKKDCCKKYKKKGIHCKKCPKM